MKSLNIKYLVGILTVLLMSDCQKFIFENPFDPNCPKELFTPGSLTAQQQGSTIVLTWTQGNKKISGFKIERKVGSGAWSSVGPALDNSSTSWTDSNLTGGQSHEYRIVAYAGNNNSNIVSTTPITPQLAPAATTLAATIIGGSASATLNGTVNGNGLATTVSFEYGETISYGKSISATPGTVTGNNQTNVNAAVTGLTPGTTYHFRIKAVNSSGTAYGTDLTFTISCIIPTVATLAATNISGTSATLNAQVNANGCTATVTFEYGETTSFGSSVAATPNVVSGSNMVNVSAGITVQPGKTYYFRVKAVNSAGTVNSTELPFSTTCILPNAITLAATNVTGTSATLNGQATGNGCNTTVTFEYGETTSYGSSIAATPGTVSSNSAANVNALITITPGKTYHYRLKTVNGAGTILGTDVIIQPYCALPSAITSQPSTTATTAVLNGQANANDCSTTVTFEYGETTSYGQSIAATPNLITGKTLYNVSAVLTGLTPGKTYNYRTKAVNSAGTISGNNVSFAMPCILPTVVTLAPTNVGNTTATLNAQVNANGCSTTVIFEYGETTSFGMSVAASPGTVSGNALTVVSATINIVAGKTYYYRIKATNGAGPVVGSNMTIFPGCTAPTATTLAATNLTGTSATLNGQVNPNNCITTVSFDYGETTAYGQSVALSSGTVSGYGLSNVSTLLSGLLPGKTYNYRIRTVNTSGTTLGTNSQFTTPCLSPSATTLGITNLTAGTVTLNAQVNPNGCVTTVYFDYGETTLLGSSVFGNPATITGNSLINTSVTINIAAGKSYYFRVRAVNSTGTGLGNNNTFSSSCPLQTVSTSAANNLTNTTARLNGQVNPNGSCTVNVTFEYGLTTTYGTSVQATPNSLTGSTMQNVYANISGLQQNTIYHYRIVATNSSNTVRGSDMIFTTPEDEPFTVKTESLFDPFNGLISGLDWDNGRIDFKDGNGNVYATLWAEIVGGYYNLFYSYETFLAQEYITNFTPVASGRNFELETSIRIQKSSHDGSATGIISVAGLAFEVNGNWIHYYFLTDGTIKVKLNNTELFTKTSGVSDPRSFNTLKTARIGAEIYFYLNGRFLTKVPLVTGTVPKIGFSVAGGSQVDYLSLQVEGSTKSLMIGNQLRKPKEAPVKVSVY